MKNTAIGNHAGPVGSTTTSNRVPGAAPSNAATSIAVRLATVGNALRFVNVDPEPSNTRTECAEAIPRSIPTNRLSPTEPPVVSMRTGPSEKQRHRWPRPQGRPEPRLPPMCCKRVRPQRVDPLSSSGASEAGSSATIRLTRPTPSLEPPQCGSQRHHPNQPGPTMQPLEHDREMDPHARCAYMCGWAMSGQWLRATPRPRRDRCRERPGVRCRVPGRVIRV